MLEKEEILPFHFWTYKRADISIHIYASISMSLSWQTFTNCQHTYVNTKNVLGSIHQEICSKHIEQEAMDTLKPDKEKKSLIWIITAQVKIGLQL